MNVRTKLFECSHDEKIPFAGCADSVDIGETSYSMVLAEDLNGDGRTDLLVTTMNGNVYVFETPAKHHPLGSWTSQVRAWLAGIESA